MIYMEVIETGDIQIACEAYPVAGAGEGNRSTSGSGKMEEKHAVDIRISDDRSTQDRNLDIYFFRSRYTGKYTP